VSASGLYDLGVIFDQAADGTHVVFAMLVVGLVFLSVIGIGELVRSFTHRRSARRGRSH
jgi:TRAP-type mannitol/chloroaromatic compound transport system permease small subunit